MARFYSIRAEPPFNLQLCMGHPLLDQQPQLAAESPARAVAQRRTAEPLNLLEGAALSLNHLRYYLDALICRSCCDSKTKTPNISFKVTPFGVCQLTSYAGHACGSSVWWRPSPYPTCGFLRRIASKLSAATEKASTASASTTSGASCFYWTEQGAMEIEITDYH